MDTPKSCEHVASGTVAACVTEPLSKRQRVVESEDSTQAWQYVVESASHMLSDAVTYATRLKTMSVSPTEQTALMRSICTYFDTVVDLCLTVSGPLLTSLARGLEGDISGEHCQHIRAEVGSVRFSGALLLTQCFRVLSLHSTKTVTDDMFLLLVDTYTNSNDRSMRYVPMFITFIVLPRLRNLNGPVSRVLLKALELLTQRCSRELVRFGLCKCLVTPTCVISSQEGTGGRHTGQEHKIKECGFQLECIQRMIRQVWPSIVQAFGSPFILNSRACWTKIT